MFYMYYSNNNFSNGFYKMTHSLKYYRIVNRAIKEPGLLIKSEPNSINS